MFLQDNKVAHMKYSIFTIFSVFILACGTSDSKNVSVEQISVDPDKSVIESSQGDNHKTETIKVDSLALLLEELKSFNVGDEHWDVIGGLKTAELTFKDVGFGDLYHIFFVDDKGKEYDFNGNSTKIELDKAAELENDDDGIVPNKKYINKRFRVVWRHLKLKYKPRDEMEMYYEEHDEIVYLKKL